MILTEKGLRALSVLFCIAFFSFALGFFGPSNKETEKKIDNIVMPAKADYTIEKEVIPRQTKIIEDNPALKEIPDDYLRWYKKAAKRYHLSWQLLVAIGSNETKHGQLDAPGVTSGLNFAECCAGPMQLCIVASCGETGYYFARDPQKDGFNIYSKEDAIFTAAAYLASLQRDGYKDEYLLAAYNAGPGNVSKYDGVPPFEETQLYVENGMELAEKLDYDQ